MLITYNYFLNIENLFVFCLFVLLILGDDVIRLNSDFPLRSFQDNWSRLFLLKTKDRLATYNLLK